VLLDDECLQRCGHFFGTTLLVFSSNLARLSFRAWRCEPGEADVLVSFKQFIDRDRNHFMLLQDLTYEALLADRQKIV
jgi:hypothetical protein